MSLGCIEHPEFQYLFISGISGSLILQRNITTWPLYDQVIHILIICVQGLAYISCNKDCDYLVFLYSYYYLCCLFRSHQTRYVPQG